MKLLPPRPVGKRGGNVGRTSYESKGKRDAKNSSGLGAHAGRVRVRIRGRYAVPRDRPAATVSDRRSSTDGERQHAKRRGGQPDADRAQRARGLAVAALSRAPVQAGQAAFWRLGVSV